MPSNPCIIRPVLRDDTQHLLILPVVRLTGLESLRGCPPIFLLGGCRMGGCFLHFRHNISQLQHLYNRFEDWCTTLCSSLLICLGNCRHSHWKTTWLTRTLSKQLAFSPASLLAKLVEISAESRVDRKICHFIVHTYVYICNYNRASDVCMYVCMYVSHVLDRQLLERLASPSPKSQVMFASALSWIGDFFSNFLDSYFSS